MSPWGTITNFPSTTAKWIYNTANAAASATVGTVYFGKKFTSSINTTATIYIAADNLARIFVNGINVMANPYSPNYITGGWNGAANSVVFNVIAGTNTLSIAVTNGGTAPNPAGLFAAVYINTCPSVTCPSPKPVLSIQTDATCECVTNVASICQSLHHHHLCTGRAVRGEAWNVKIHVHKLFPLTS